MEFGALQPRWPPRRWPAARGPEGQHKIQPLWRPVGRMGTGTQPGTAAQAPALRLPPQRALPAPGRGGWGTRQGGRRSSGRGHRGAAGGGVLGARPRGAVGAGWPLPVWIRVRTPPTTAHATSTRVHATSTRTRAPGEARAWLVHARAGLSLHCRVCAHAPRATHTHRPLAHACARTAHRHAHAGCSPRTSPGTSGSAPAAATRVPARRAGCSLRLAAN